MSYQETINQRVRRNKGRILTYLEECDGNIRDACRKLGIYRSTFYRWLDRDEYFKKEAENIIELMKKFHGSAYLQEISKTFAKEEDDIRKMLAETEPYFE